MKQTNESRHWLTKKKIVCFSLLILVAIYIGARPTLERLTNLKLPSLISDNDNENLVSDQPDGRQSRQSSTQSQSKSDTKLRGSNSSNKTVGDENERADDNDVSGGVESFRLTKLDDGSFQSPAGLIYARTSNEHRLDHVLRHSKDMPERAIHGVFDGDRDTILQLIDEAYQLTKTKSARVKTTSQSGRTVHVINLKRKIGYVGGQTGKRKNYPECRYLQLVLDKQDVITAYPVNSKN